MSRDCVSEYNEAERADYEWHYEGWDTVFGFVHVVVALAEEERKLVG